MAERMELHRPLQQQLAHFGPHSVDYGLFSDRFCKLSLPLGIGILSFWCWAFADPTTGGTSPEYVMFTTKAPPKIEIFTSETSSTTPLPTYPDKIPLDMTPQQCVILSVEASSEASAYDESVSSTSQFRRPSMGAQS